MAYTSRQFEVPAREVFAVLIDRRRIPDGWSAPRTSVASIRTGRSWATRSATGWASDP